MQIPHKAEFFDPQINYMCMSPIPAPNINYDYLTIAKTTLTIPKIMDIQRGWYAHVTQGTTVIYQGIVTSVEQSKNITKVTCKPLLSLFDVQAYQDRTLIYSVSIEQFIKTIIDNLYVNTTDNVQKIPGLTVTARTTTNGVKLNLKDNIHNLHDILIKSLEIAHIIVDVTLYPQNKSIDVVIANYSEYPIKTIESDLNNIISRDFVLRDDYGIVNKVVIINEDNEAEQAVYYADDYAPPSVWEIDYISVSDDETFADKAAETAAEALAKKDFDNLIEISVKQDDKIINNMSIGQKCKIIKNKTVYTSVLTGYEIKNNIITYIFGSIRMDLTKILETERRYIND